MYSRMVAGGSVGPGCGPCRLDFGSRPFPLATSKRLPSGVTRTEVGYQPTGMKPSERLAPGCETSKTATLLLQALATKSRRPSGESARLFGVEPGGECGCSAALRVSSGRPVAASSTVTVLRLALATNSRAPSGASTSSFGCSWVGQTAVTARDSRSITATCDLAHRLT